MPNYRDAAGAPTLPDDPHRMIWYGLCSFWTDDWDKLDTQQGIPCCPECKSPGFMTDAAGWLDGVRRYERNYPDYGEFVTNHKEKCLGAGVGFAEAWRRWRETHGRGQDRISGEDSQRTD